MAEHILFKKNRYTFLDDIKKNEIKSTINHTQIKNFYIIYSTYVFIYNPLR